MTAPTKSQLEFLRSIDTPTVCNLVELVAPERRGHGYTVKHLHCPFPDLPPIVGFARTVTAKAKDKVALGDYMGKRLDYLDYIAAEPRPTVCVIEDIDDDEDRRRAKCYPFAQSFTQPISPNSCRTHLGWPVRWPETTMRAWFSCTSRRLRKSSAKPVWSLCMRTTRRS